MLQSELLIKSEVIKIDLLKYFPIKRTDRLIPNLIEFSSFTCILHQDNIAQVGLYRQRDKRKKTDISLHMALVEVGSLRHAKSSIFSARLYLCLALAD